MSEYFVDTSALAKRYLPEIGSGWVDSWINPQAGNTIIISSLSTVEMMSVLMRHEREGLIFSVDRIELQNSFFHHLENQYITIELEDSVLARARDIIVRHPLRGADAIQLASAVQVTETLKIAPVFVSTRQPLLDAAATEGFKIDNPTTHP